MQAAEPVSWLRLERYHLGELSAEEAAEVERALASSPETRACLDEIRKPIALSPVPEPPSGDHKSRLTTAIAGRWRALSFAIAAAAGVALFALSHSRSDDHGGVLRPGASKPSVTAPSRSARVKGGDVALDLVRERAGAIDTQPTSFAEGDRFKVLMTCPPDFDGQFDVVVIQDGAAYFPYGDPSNVACGNAVPLPGAFTISGRSAATVCATWTRSPSARHDIARQGIRAMRDAAVCATLDAE